MKADDQVGNHRRIDNFHPIVSISTSRPNDKTQHAIPSRQPTIHGSHETIERSKTYTRPSTNGGCHPEFTGFDEGA
jgi:hypothetical protein